MTNRRLTMLSSLAAVLLIVGCASVTQLGTQLGQGAGVLTEDEATSINRAGEALSKTIEDITPEQEYYIGRAVAASILHTYAPLENRDANTYLNNLGQTLAMASDRPETFGGYHFLLLESDEINAFAAPGGLILVTRGMLACCAGEDELAAVLAHEIAHVQNRDGLQAIKKSRLTSAFTIIGVEAARTLGDEDLKQLAEDFEASIDDIAQTLINSGYARGAEQNADHDAAVILHRVGYDPQALVRMLGVMGERWKPSGPGFARTHPSPDDRVKSVRSGIPEADVVPTPAARQTRFAANLGGI